MKILWVKTDFLHPTTRGGQIRTLEMLKCLHRRHEVHYVAFDDKTNPEGLERSAEYCTRVYPVEHKVPPHRSLHFAAQLARGLVSPIPVAVQRYVSGAMKRQVSHLLATEKFDSVVCDFLFPALNVPKLRQCVLFQHNVESVIWKRHTEEAKDRAKKAYFAVQARRMENFERKISCLAGHIVAVSEVDRENIRKLFGVTHVSCVKTGVDIEYFKPPGQPAFLAELIFAGSMDWLPNIDGVEFFVREVLPLIHKERPDCRLLVAGRKPSAAVEELGRLDPRVIVTGTVPDIRPYLWGSTVSVVPLRIGGGTRLKIFEAIAAGLPVVSTTVGAEGLPLLDGRHIAIGDTPEQMARHCLHLLKHCEARVEMSEHAWTLVAGEYSWDAVTRDFEDALTNGPRPD